MKALKILVILVLAYVAVVVAFESLLGYFQPANPSTMVIATTGSDGVRSERVLAQVQHADKLYAAANHWPRAWYREALANPQVQVTIDDVTSNYTAVQVEGEEHNAVNTSRPLGLGFRILTGFPPRYFVRLDPS